MSVTLKVGLSVFAIVMGIVGLTGIFLDDGGVELKRNLLERDVREYLFSDLSSDTSLGPSLTYLSREHASLSDLTGEDKADRERELLQQAMHQIIDRAFGRTDESKVHVKVLAKLVRERFADEILQDKLSVWEGRRDVKLTPKDIFEFVEAGELENRSVETLDRLVELLLQDIPSHRVRFAVYTDDTLPKQDSELPTNWELSTAWAAKLADYLIEKGVASERLSIAGYGEYHSVTDSSTQEEQGQNQRVDVIIRPPPQLWQ